MAVCRMWPRVLWKQPYCLKYSTVQTTHLWEKRESTVARKNWKKIAPLILMPWVHSLLKCLFMQTFTYSCMDSVSLSVNLSFTHSTIHWYNWPLEHIYMYIYIYLIHSFKRSIMLMINSFSQALIHWHMLSHIHPGIHSFTHSNFSVAIHSLFPGP